VRCEETREVAAELALGIAPGDERARVLEHAASCADCRAVLNEHSLLADELLLVAPAHEPQAGFEWRVVERLTAKGPRGFFARLPRGQVQRAAIAAAAIAVVVGITVVTMLAAFDENTQQPRNIHSLSAVKGEFVDAARLEEPNGAHAGEVFGYQGSPSWLLVKVDPEYSSDSYRCELLTRAGKRIQLDGFRLDRVSGTWGQPIPVSLRDVAEVRVFDGSKDGPLRARFNTE
jgi:hypothetical protein